MRPRSFLVTTVMVAAASVPVAGVASASESGRTAQPNDPTVMLVVDTSGSMEGGRLQEAQTALTTMVDGLADGQAVGLRSYGGDCGDGGLVRVPIGSGNRPELRSAIDALVADGGTPTPEAIEGAAADLADVTGPRAIVLVSDGESTCGDPCATVVRLKNEQGIDIKIHTVGFQAPDAAEAELACIAQAGGGTHNSVVDLAGLTRVLMDVISDNPSGPDQIPSVPVGPVDAGTGPSSGGAGVVLPLTLAGGTALLAAGLAGVRRPMRRR